MCKNVGTPIIGSEKDKDRMKRLDKKQINKEKWKQIWKLLGEIIFGMEF